jgi:hypothetical protein
MIWTNALTGYNNAKNATSYTYVYKAGGLPIKDSRDSNAGTCDAVIPDSSATGFRLPTMNEWELAARYIVDSNSAGDIRTRESIIRAIMRAAGLLTILTRLRQTKWHGMIQIAV